MDGGRVGSHLGRPTGEDRLRLSRREDVGGDFWVAMGLHLGHYRHSKFVLIPSDKPCTTLIVDLRPDPCAACAELDDRERRVRARKPRKRPVALRHREDESVELDRPDRRHPLPRRRPYCRHLLPAGPPRAHASVRPMAALPRGRPSRRHQYCRGRPDSAAMPPHPEAVGPDRVRNLRFDRDLLQGGLSSRQYRRVCRLAPGLLSDLHHRALAAEMECEARPVPHHGRWLDVREAPPPPSLLTFQHD